MAYEIEAMNIATEAFIRNVGDQLELTDEQQMNLADRLDGLDYELAACTGQSEANELLADRVGEATNYDRDTQLAVAGSIDFFWQIYNDAKQSDLNL